MIQVKEVKVIEIFVGDVTLGLFQVTSEWEGLKKMESLRTKEVIIAMSVKPEGGMENCFAGLFAGISGLSIVTDHQVVSASPNIANVIREFLSSKKETKND